MLTNTYTLQRDDELKHGYGGEAGIRWLNRIKLTIQHGGVNKRQSIGSAAPSIWIFNYKFTPWFNLAVRNRYNHNSIVQPILNGETG